MANVTFIRGNTSKIDGTPVADGQLLFDTDKKTLQMDNGTTRENFAGAVASNVSVDNSTMKVVKTNTVQSAIQDLDTNASNTSNIVSDAWTSRSYEVGEYAISDNKLWKCLVKNSVKPSESANWTEVSVGGEISQVNSNLTDTNTELQKRLRFNGEVNNPRTDTVNQGFYIYDNDATDKPSNTAGAVISIVVDSSPTSGVVCRLAIDTTGRLFTAVYRAGQSYGNWVEK